MINYKNTRREDGQTLLEVLLAFGISILVLSSVATGIVTSLNNIQYTKNQDLATTYAQEGLAAVRQKRDSGWYGTSSLMDYSKNTIYCIDNDLYFREINTDPTINCVTKGYAVPVGGIFSREVVFQHGSASCDGVGSLATVTVSWSDGKCSTTDVVHAYCHSVALVSCFSNIDEKIQTDYLNP